MAQYQVGYHFTLRDVDGASSVHTIHDGKVSDATTLAQLATHLAALTTDLQAVTNAKIVQTSFSVLNTVLAGVGTDAEFPLVSQRAVLHFSNAGGSRAIFAIPAPKEVIFKSPPSDDIVDPAQADMATFISEFIADAADANAAPYTFQGGALSSRARTRRRSIHT